MGMPTTITFDPDIGFKLSDRIRKGIYLFYPNTMLVYQSQRDKGEDDIINKFNNLLNKVGSKPPEKWFLICKHNLIR